MVRRGATTPRGDVAAKPRARRYHAVHDDTGSSDFPQTKILAMASIFVCGQRGIRTPVGISRRVYSAMRLTTPPSAQCCKF